MFSLFVQDKQKWLGTTTEYESQFAYLCFGFWNPLKVQSRNILWNTKTDHCCILEWTKENCLVSWPGYRTGKVSQSSQIVNQVTNNKSILSPNFVLHRQQLITYWLAQAVQAGLQVTDQTANIGIGLFPWLSIAPGSLIQELPLTFVIP